MRDNTGKTAHQNQDNEAVERTTSPTSPLTVKEENIMKNKKVPSESMKQPSPQPVSSIDKLENPMGDSKVGMPEELSPEQSEDYTTGTFQQSSTSEVVEKSTTLPSAPDTAEENKKHNSEPEPISRQSPQELPESDLKKKSSSSSSPSAKEDTVENNSEDVSAAGQEEIKSKDNLSGTRRPKSNKLKSLFSKLRLKKGSKIQIKSGSENERSEATPSSENME
ncbi:hypothetical protein Aperf_G00000100605 [Anoplocephala perfoliata]